MRGAWTAGLGLVFWACGGTVEAQRASTASDASSQVDSATTIVDASTSDTSDEIDCVPSASDPTGCSGKAFCVAWVFTDGAAPTGKYPEGVVRSACEFGQLDEVCDGKPPIASGYAPYTNQTAWAVCAEP